MSKFVKSALCLLLALPVLANAKINVFACEPEWMSLAKEIGGDNVEAFSATTAMQNPHFISAKPSLLAKMRRSDLVFCSGSGLEAGWLPVLLKSAGKKQVQPGNTGHLMASDQVSRLEVIDDLSLVDRSFGDVHPEGNPHVHLDPERLLTIARALTDRLSALDVANKARFEANLVKFESKLISSIASWQPQIDALKGKQYIVYHKNWSYLGEWLQLDIVDTIEPKPGIAPTIGHISNLVSKYKGAPIEAILLAPFEDKSAAESLSEKIGAPVIVLPYTSGDSLIKLYGEIIEALNA